MIYVSSSCVRAKTIGAAVKMLADQGYRNIELSGGTSPYPGLEQDLLSLQKEYGLAYLCHNYFPPPPRAFVINLASPDEEVARMSLEHLGRAIALSKLLGGDKFGFHAGFLINIPIEQVGKSIARQELFDRTEASNVFVKNFLALEEKAGMEVELYLENNVVSATNLGNYKGVNPFFMTDYEGYREFRQRIPFRVLLDLGHLKVSCNSLGLDFDSQLDQFMTATDYIHVSDNDGKSDHNGPFRKDSELYRALKKYSLTGKTFTLEVYSGDQELRTSYENLAELSGV